jgi:hypothetical protein
MKKITVCLLLFMIISRIQTITGQTNENTIVLPNSSWSILKLKDILSPHPCVSTQYIYFDGDSIVGGNAYKKVFSCDDKLHENIRYEGLMREQDEKTYLILKNSETEYLLYDFSLEEGSNFEYQDPWQQFLDSEYIVSTILYVKKVDLVEINGIQKKRIQLTSTLPYDDNVYATWIESIGSLTGLFYPHGDMRPLNSIVETLLCYLQDNELVYKYPTLSKCYYDNVEDIIYKGGVFYEKENTTTVEFKITNGFTIYPNPVNNVLIISSSNDAVSFIKITDVLGKLVYTKHLGAEKEYHIDMRPFIFGLYFLHVYDVNGRAFTFKIIKR